MISDCDIKPLIADLRVNRILAATVSSSFGSYLLDELLENCPLNVLGFRLMSLVREELQEEHMTILCVLKLRFFS